MTSTSTAYFSELSLFTENDTCSNHISVEWKAPVYDQVNAERSGSQYGDTGWPIQSYQLERCSYQIPPSMEQNSYSFYRDKINVERNKLMGSDLKFKGSNSVVYSSNGLWSGRVEFFFLNFLRDFCCYTDSYFPFAPEFKPKSWMLQKYVRHFKHV